MSLRTSYRAVAIKLSSILEVFMDNLLFRLANGEKVTGLSNTRILELAREFYADRHDILEVLSICQPNTPARYQRLEEQERELKQILINHEYDDVSVDVQSFLIKNDIPIPQNEVDYKRLSREIVKTMLDINQLEQSRATQDFKSEQRILEKYLPTVEHPKGSLPEKSTYATDDSHLDISSSAVVHEEAGSLPVSESLIEDSTAASTPPGIRPMRLQEALDTYIEMKISRGDWTEKNQTDMVGKIGWLPFMLENPFLHEITHEQMLAFSTNLLKMPGHRKNSKKYDGMSPKELLEMDIPRTISVATANLIISTVHTFFEDCCVKDYMLRNRAEGIRLKDKRSANSKKERLDASDLSVLFHALERDRNSFEHDWQYWLPILGYFTGCRLNEMCQLHLDDVRSEDGIYYLSINDETEDKHLKNSASYRNVPLHPALIDIGFIDFWKSKVDIKSEYFYLFSGMSADKKQKLSHYPSKILNPYLRSIGITQKTKTFHSLRHTFKFELDLAKVSDKMSARLMGHQVKEEGNPNYKKDLYIKYYYSEAITKMIHEADYSMLIKK